MENSRSRNMKLEELAELTREKRAKRTPEEWAKMTHEEWAEETADHLGITEPHDENCRDEYLCREHFIEKLMELGKIGKVEMIAESATAARPSTVKVFSKGALAFTYRDRNGRLFDVRVDSCWNRDR